MSMGARVPVGYVGELDEVFLSPTLPYPNNPYAVLLNTGSPLANGVASPNCPGGQFTYNPLPEQQRPFMRLPFDRMEPQLKQTYEGWYGHFPGMPFDNRISLLDEP